MSAQDVAGCIPKKWYHWHRFSVLPNVRFRKADQYNSWSLNIHWLVFRVWTNIAPRLGVDVELSDQDFMLRVNLPYLHVAAIIPVFPESLGHKLWRR